MTRPDARIFRIYRSIGEHQLARRRQFRLDRHVDRHARRARLTLGNAVSYWQNFCSAGLRCRAIIDTSGISTVGASYRETLRGREELVDLLPHTRDSLAMLRPHF